MRISSILATVALCALLLSTPGWVEASGDKSPRKGDESPRKGDESPRKGDKSPRKEGSGSPKTPKKSLTSSNGSEKSKVPQLSLSSSGGKGREKKQPKSPRRLSEASSSMSGGDTDMHGPFQAIFGGWTPWDELSWKEAGLPHPSTLAWNQFQEMMHVIIQGNDGSGKSVEDVVKAWLPKMPKPQKGFASGGLSLSKESSSPKFKQCREKQKTKKQSGKSKGSPPRSESSSSSSHEQFHLSQPDPFDFDAETAQLFGSLHEDLQDTIINMGMEFGSNTKAMHIFAGEQFGGIEGLLKVNHEMLAYANPICMPHDIIAPQQIRYGPPAEVLGMSQDSLEGEMHKGEKFIKREFKKGADHLIRQLEEYCPTMPAEHAREWLFPGMRDWFDTLKEIVDAGQADDGTIGTYKDLLVQAKVNCETFYLGLLKGAHTGWSVESYGHPEPLSLGPSSRGPAPSQPKPPKKGSGRKKEGGGSPRGSM